MSEIWARYRAGWRRKPWLLPIGVVAAVLVVTALVGTFRRDPIAIAFIPGLILLYLHHVLVTRAASG